MQMHNRVILMILIPMILAHGTTLLKFLAKIYSIGLFHYKKNTFSKEKESFGRRRP